MKIIWAGSASGQYNSSWNSKIFVIRKNLVRDILLFMQII